MSSLLKQIYRTIVPLSARRMASEARLRARVRRGELVNLHVHYPHYDVSPERIDEDARQAIEGGLAYAQHVAALLGRESKPFPDLRGLKVIEIGPGLAFGPLLVCRAAGAAEVAALDAFPVAWHEAYHPAFYSRFCQLAQQRWPERDWSAARTLAASSGRENPDLVRVVAGDIGAADLRELNDSHFDATVSNAALEHVLDLTRAMRQLARITRPGGVGVHLIDLSHHFDPQRPLEFLTIPDQRYERLLARRQGREGNRARASELRRMFADAGFIVRRVDVIQRADEEYVERLRPRMLDRYAAMDIADLAILSARFRVRRGVAEQANCAV